MSERDDVNSTQKLLHVIRGSQAPTAKSPASLERPETRQHSSENAPLIKALPFARRMQIGVDIAESTIRLVKMQVLGEGRFEMIGHQKVVIPKHLRDANRVTEQAAFLRKMLSGFCGPSKKTDVWALMDTSNAEARYLKIPKVANRQIARTVAFVFRKEVAIDLEQNIFDYDILGTAMEDGVEKIEAMAYAVPKVDVAKVKNLFWQSGFPLKGISTYPFAVQNLISAGWLGEPKRCLCLLFLQRDWSRISIYAEGRLVLSREIKAGIKSIVESLQSADTRPWDFGLGEDITDGIQTPVEEDTDGDAEQVDDLLKLLWEEGKPIASRQLAHMDRNAIFALAQTAVDRVIRQIEMTVQHYNLNFEQRPIDHIYIAGMLSNYDLLCDYIRQQIGVPASTLDPFSDNSRFEADFAPDSLQERQELSPAVGMALSSAKRTPNYLYSQEEKSTTKKAEWINRLIWMAFTVLMMIGLGVYFWQEGVIEDHQVEMMGLQRELDQYAPQADHALVASAVARLRKKQGMQHRFVRRYLSIALITEISKRTPSNVRLSFLDMGPKEAAAEEETAETESSQVRMGGFVFGAPEQLDAYFSTYLVQLKDSHLVEQIRVETKEIDYYQDQPVIRFVARLTMG